MKVDYKQVKTIPFRRVLDRYGGDFREQNVAGDVKLVGHCPICHPDGGHKRNNNQFQVCIKSPNPNLIEGALSASDIHQRVIFSNSEISSSTMLVYRAAP